MIITISCDDVERVTSKFPEKNTVYRYDDKSIYISGVPDNDTSDARVYVKDNSIVQMPIGLLRGIFDLLYMHKNKLPEDEILDILEAILAKIEYEIIVLSEDETYSYDYRHNFIYRKERLERIDRLEWMKRVTNENIERFQEAFRRTKKSNFTVDKSRAERVANMVKSSNRTRMKFVSMEKIKNGEENTYSLSDGRIRQRIEHKKLKKFKAQRKAVNHRYYENHKEKWSKYYEKKSDKSE